MWESLTDSEENCIYKKKKKLKETATKILLHLGLGKKKYKF